MRHARACTLASQLPRQPSCPHLARLPWAAPPQRAPPPLRACRPRPSGPRRQQLHEPCPSPAQPPPSRWSPPRPPARHHQPPPRPMARHAAARPASARGQPWPPPQTPSWRQAQSSPPPYRCRGAGARQLLRKHRPLQPTPLLQALTPHVVPQVELLWRASPHAPAATCMRGAGGHSTAHAMPLLQSHFFTTVTLLLASRADASREAQLSQPTPAPPLHHACRLTC
jgi:hypothetical protein